MTTVLRVEGLEKRYGSLRAVDGVSLNVDAGEVFGLLGPNGAGKTTTLECVEGLRVPDAGTVDVLGHDPARDRAAVRRLVGVQLQTSGLPATMTVSEAMRFVCAHHGVSPRRDLLRRLGLGDKLDRRFADLSVGQQRRLVLALAVAHNPKLLFLDEPTAGLDVESRAELHALIGELREAGTAVVLATHDMAEAEKLAGRIAIVLAGRIVAEGTPREITAAGNSLTRITVSTSAGSLLEDGADLPAVTSRARENEYVVMLSADAGATVLALVERIRSLGDTLSDLRVERPSLEERFLEITGTEVGV